MTAYCKFYYIDNSLFKLTPSIHNVCSYMRRIAFSHVQIDNGLHINQSSYTTCLIGYKSTTNYDECQTHHSIKTNNPIHKV